VQLLSNKLFAKSKNLFWEFTLTESGAQTICLRLILQRETHSAVWILVVVGRRCEFENELLWCEVWLLLHHPQDRWYALVHTFTLVYAIFAHLGGRWNKFKHIYNAYINGSSVRITWRASTSLLDYSSFIYNLRQRNDTHILIGLHFFARKLWNPSFLTFRPLAHGRKS